MRSRIVILMAVISLALAAHSPAQCPRWLPGDPGEGADQFVYAATTWDPDGPGPLDPVLVIGGAFNHGGGWGAGSHIATWNGSSWGALGTGLTGGSYGVMATTVYNGQLIASGDFSFAGQTALHGIGRWDGTAWQPMGVSLLVTAIITLTVYNGDLIAGGLFNGVGSPNIARWD